MFLHLALMCKTLPTDITIKPPFLCVGGNNMIFNGCWILQHNLNRGAYFNSFLGFLRFDRIKKGVKKGFEKNYYYYYFLKWPKSKEFL